MNLSLKKIGFFFLTLLLLGAFLYPRDLFLGYIYEGFSDLSRSEAYYISYLQKKPTSKFATLRLAHLYSRIGEPEKATPLLKNLYEHRKWDWQTAGLYLDHLEALHDQEALYRARLEVANNFIEKPMFPRERITALLDDALLYARWRQKDEEVYQILGRLTVLSKDPDSYQGDIEALDRAHKKIAQVEASVRKRLEKSPDDLFIWQDLAAVLAIQGKYDEAVGVIDDGIARHPDSYLLFATRAYLHEKMKRGDLAIEDLQKLLGIRELDPKDRLSYKGQLASLYSDEGRDDEALALYREILDQDEGRVSNWESVFYTLVRLKRFDDAIDLSRDYLETHPEDDAWRKEVAGLYLYEKKDLGQIPFYRDYIHRSGNETFAKDVAYLFLQREKIGEAASWAEEMSRVFPGSRDLVSILMETYSRQDRDEEALEVGLRFLRSHPNDRPMVLQTALLCGRLNRREEALALFERYVNLRPGDAQGLMTAGREIFFQGLPLRSEEYLYRATRLRASYAEAWYWLSEAYYAQGKVPQGNYAARKVLESLKGRKLSREEARIELKSRARLWWGPEVVSDYAVAKMRDRTNLDLQSDLVDLLVENHQYKRARMEVQEMKRRFPKEGNRIEAYEARVAFAMEEWDEVARLLENIVRRNPRQMTFRRDMAYALYHAGDWPRAREELEFLWRETGDDLQIAGTRREIKRVYDHRVTTEFGVTEVGSERWFVGKISSQGFLSRRWQIYGNVEVGQYRSNTLGFDGKAVKGRAGVGFFEKLRWIGRAGVGFGVSGARKTASPFVELTYRPWEALGFTAGFDYRTLRTDLASAVARGTLEDQARFEWTSRPWERLIFSGRYEFSRNYLPGGQKSLGHTIEPSLQFIVLKRPEVTVGYQYTFSDNSDRGGFLALVPLLPRVNSHYLTTSVNHRVSGRCALEGRFYIGEDTARDLHFFEGDLFGLLAGVVCEALPWLDVGATYQFGRETLTTEAGQSHYGAVSLSAHWW